MNGKKKPLAELIRNHFAPAAARHRVRPAASP